MSAAKAQGLRQFLNAIVMVVLSMDLAVPASSATSSSMPNPVTEAACIKCEEDVVGYNAHKALCEQEILAAHNLARINVGSLRASQDAADVQGRMLRTSVAGKRQELRSIRTQQAALHDAVIRAIPQLGLLQAHALDTQQDATHSAVVRQVEARAVENRDSGDDLVDRWFRCDSRLSSARLSLEACQSRAVAETSRHAARVQQYEHSAATRNNVITQANEEAKLLNRALTHASAENGRIAEHLEGLSGLKAPFSAKACIEFAGKYKVFNPSNEYMWDVTLTQTGCFVEMDTNPDQALKAVGSTLTIPGLEFGTVETGTLEDNTITWSHGWTWVRTS